MKKYIDKIKPHLAAILIIIFLAVIVFNSFLIFNWDKMFLGDMYSYRYRMEVAKISIQEYGDFIPLWSPYTMSGAPFFAKLGVDIGFFYINYLLLMILPLTITLKLSYTIPVILAGIFMYFLMVYLKLEKKYALLSAILYMFNGWLYSRFSRGHLTTISPYSITPLIILYIIKIFREKDWIKNSVIAGILFAIQIHAGPDLKVTIWVIPIVIIYVFLVLIGRISAQKIIQISLIGLIIVAVTFGLTAVKVLPASQYLKLGSRSHVDYKNARAQRARWSFSDFIEPIPPKYDKTLYRTHYNIGIIAFLFACFAVFKKFKNKTVLFFASVAVLSVFLGTGSFVFYLFWRYVPFYDSFRYPSRILSIYVFSMAALAGIGASLLGNKLKKRYNWSTKKINLCFVVLVMLILVNNVVFGISPYRLFYEWRNPDEVLQDNHILNYLGKEPGLFRIHIYETTGIDWGTEFQTVPLGLQTLYGYDAAWLVDYMNIYLSVALQQPARFWGILNTKYITSQKELNITGLSFVNKFPECEKCFPDEPKIQKIGGPYLYQNQQFLPRAYIVNNSILVVGKDDKAKQTIYGLMLNSMFNPANTVIIQGKESVNDYSLSQLERYDAIFLTEGSIDQNSISLLKNYIQQGGILVPDITKNELQINNEKINGILASFKGNLTPISDNDHLFVNFDKRQLNIGRKQGFLVYSEILTHYPGWIARADSMKKEIERADGVIGAVYLDKPVQEVILEFKPASFVIGSVITVMSIIALILFFVFWSIRNNPPKKAGD
ncbi:hypothetical protein KY366_07020 [Candidatus Woesearchaeota archaeon]|nr:hypothetical protein [Candidatus Woesearchaeota archaeon]